MCQLYACISGRPTLSDLHLSAMDNRDGAGIAWVENGVVRWEKGLPSDADKIDAMIKKLPFPYLIHFRFGTAGADDQHNTHPWLVTRSLKRMPLSGSGPAVLAHNGHYGSYEAVLDELKPDTVTTSRKEDGKTIWGPINPLRRQWTDTRILAFLAALDDADELLTKSGQKIAVLTPQGFKIYNSNFWAGSPVDNHTKGFWQSAPMSRFPRGYYYQYGGLDGYGWRGGGDRIERRYSSNAAATSKSVSDWAWDEEDGIYYHRETKAAKKKDVPLLPFPAEKSTPSRTDGLGFTIEYYDAKTHIWEKVDDFRKLNAAERRKRWMQSDGVRITNNKTKTVTTHYFGDKEKLTAIETPTDVVVNASSNNGASPKVVVNENRAPGEKTKSKNGKFITKTTPPPQSKGFQVQHLSKNAVKRLRRELRRKSGARKGVVERMLQPFLGRLRG